MNTTEEKLKRADELLVSLTESLENASKDENVSNRINDAHTEMKNLGLPKELYQNYFEAIEDIVAEWLVSLMDLE